MDVLETCLTTKQYYLGLLIAQTLEVGKLSLSTRQRYCELYATFIRETQTVKDEDVEIIETPIEEPPPPLRSTPVVATETTCVEKSPPRTHTRVRLLCNWTDSKGLCDLWNKMSQGNYTWNNLQVVWEEPYDYTVVVNCPPISEFPDPRQTILFRMEPNMEKHPELWGDWSNPKDSDFLKVCRHETEYNNNEWHLSKTYSELLTLEITKTESLSTVLSGKYKDIGQIKRVDFARYLDSKGMIHVYGSNRFGYANYKGSPPPHCKDEALFPYKYTFNCENNEIRNYYTEKLIDGILAECLTFYHGPPNIRELIDERAYVWLELVDFERDYQLVCKAIEEDWWSQRIEYIRAEKQRILNELQFFPRLEKIIKEIENKENDTSTSSHQ